ncbi:hypothetical protein [Massilia sp. S19_KUP03_FR1]|uniref:hypothetical protein n=1 Tax=Massilia sp. S19_KUP03_FR1 TaxID=3025503 RepID=UPI002FCD98C1
MICTGCGTQSAGSDNVCDGCGKNAQRRVFRLGQAMRQQAPRGGGNGWRWSALLLPSALAFTIVGIVFLIMT